MLDFLHQLAVQQFNSLESHIRLVIFHPNYLPQHRLLGDILPLDAVHVRFEGANLTQADLERQLDEAIASQTGVKSLSQRTTLVLDECDRAVPASFDWLVSRLLAHTDIECIFVLTRQVPYRLLSDPKMRAQASIIPADESHMLWNYARRDTSDPSLLEVRALGSGRALFNGKTLDDWDGALPRALFFFLCDRMMTTRNDIFATFWPDLQVKDATNVFHVTKRKISEKLTTDLTTYHSGYYHIAESIELSYDVAMFTGALQESAIAPTREEKIALLWRALYFYRGDFLTSVNAPWAAQRRQELRQSYIEAKDTLYHLL